MSSSLYTKLISSLLNKFKFKRVVSWEEKINCELYGLIVSSKKHLIISSVNSGCNEDSNSSIIKTDGLDKAGYRWLAKIVIFLVPKDSFKNSIEPPPLFPW